MPVKTDYQNANIIITRDDKLIHTFTFVEFIPASKIKSINDIKNRMVVIYRKEATPETQLEIEEEEKMYFETLMGLTCTNPMSHADALDKFTLPEINLISQEAYIFLVNWSSTAEVKLYGLSLAKTQDTNKEQPKLLSTQT